MKRCEVCPKEAGFSCSWCETVFYCSKEHQIEHWKSKHSHYCQKKVSPFDEKALGDLMKKRYSVRKQYYENYSNKIFDLCLLDAKVMVDLDRQIKNLTKNLNDQFDYGASVCLLVRSHLLLKDKKSARAVLEKYLFDSRSLFFDLSDIPSISQELTQESKDQLHKKMNLISTIANLSNAIEMDVIKYYVLYTKIIELVFGNVSTEASNCYFLVGCYFAEEGFLKKAIACFMKSASCRKQMAGDCYFNIGILYSLKKKFPKALEMFEEAAKKRMEQYGEDSEEIAEVLENMGIIYVEINDFITGMMEYELAFKIRSSNPYSAEYRNLLDLIQELYDKLCLFIDSEQEGLKKPAIFVHLRSKIEDEEVYWRDRGHKKEEIIKEKLVVQEKEEAGKKPQDKGNITKSRRAKVVVPEVIQSPKEGSILNIKEDFINGLNQTELYLLSDLQVELESCNSDFSKVEMVGRSQFLKMMTPENLAILKEHNQKLFKLLRIQAQSKKDKKLPP